MMAQLFNVCNNCIYNALLQALKDAYRSIFINNTRKAGVALGGHRRMCIGGQVVKGLMCEEQESELSTVGERWGANASFDGQG